MNEDISGRVIFYGIFGLALVLAGLQGLATGRIKVISKKWQETRYFENMWAFILGLVYFLLGIVFCTVGYQLIKGIRPTLVHSFTDLLNVDFETGETIFFVGRMGIMFVPHTFGAIFIKPE
ncbi:MAG: hypothetical protein H7Y09_15825 [Chitinophagaceae bacterium]|nr:hypothetical protein [Anaerolineae bacterium]